jgi:hypothetical protein
LQYLDAFCFSAQGIFNALIFLFDVRASRQVLCLVCTPRCCQREEEEREEEQEWSLLEGDERGERDSSMHDMLSDSFSGVSSEYDTGNTDQYSPK